MEGSDFMTSNYSNYLYNEYENLQIKYDGINEEYRYLKYEYNLLESKNHTLNEQKKQLNIENKTLQQDNEELQKEIARLKALLNNDGTNSSLPTSMTPLNKKKVIPNSRIKSDKKNGGQPGHKKHILKRFAEEEVTEVIPHVLDVCPSCNHKDLEKKGSIYKDELDYKIVVEKKRHEFIVYECKCCGKEVRDDIPNNLKCENQYGPQIQALALSLMNQGNVAINKVRKMISGFSNGEINLSEGFITKLQKRGSDKLAKFNEDLRLEIIKQDKVYWDDTVIAIDKKRACLRYYGNDMLALYKAHLKKDKAGLDEDNILQLLPKTTTVMHDHNKVNYNKDYSYENAECNAHLLRDLQKVSDNLEHKWSSKLSILLSDTNKRRNELISKEIDSFNAEEITTFFCEFDSIMLSAFTENKEDYNKYYGKEEKTLITRILDYKNEYLAWVLNFDLPFTNNLSERSLRGIKSKMKVSGQFKNELTASYYASIKSYIETCYRNEVNEFNALLMLCLDKPFELNDIIKKENS